MSELDEFKKVVSPIAYGLAYKSKLGTTEYQQLYTEEDVTEYFSNKPQLTIPKSIADEIDCVVNPIGQIVLKSGILSDFTVEAISWIYKNNENGYIAIAYANPLTRDLVKVVEG